MYSHSPGAGQSRSVKRLPPDAVILIRSLEIFGYTTLEGACQSMTFDNGTEFSKHYLLSRRFGIQTWFCDTHSPWQKGGIENAIGRLRRQLPRKTNLNALPPHRLASFLEV